MNKIILLGFSVALVFLVAYCSLTGLATPGFYEKETANWQAQSSAQDVIDLFLVVPALLICMVLALRRPNRLLFFGGVTFYLAYTFALYCWDVHFNKLFLPYCLILGLSSYATLWCIIVVRRQGQRRGGHVISRLTGAYMILIGLAFYLLWLKEIIPSMHSGEVPASVKETGLFTNGVHVLDLSLVLPAIFISGILLWKKSSWAYYLSPVMLVFFILMDLSIACLSWLMNLQGLAGESAVAAVMCVLAACSAALLAALVRPGRPAEKPA